METVQQHEWGDPEYAPLLTRQYCKNGCGCIKYEHPFHHDVWYYDPSKTKMVYYKPPCITRTKQPEDD